MSASGIRDKLLPAAARRTPRPQVHESKRLLLVQPDHLGDIILSEPAVRLLRAALQDYQIIAVVGPWSAEVTSLAWPVDRIVEIEFPGFTRAAGGRGPIEPYTYLQQAIGRLRELQADDAIVLRDDAWWAGWLAYGSVGRHVVTIADPRSLHFATIDVEPAGSLHRTALAMMLARAYLANIGRPFDPGTSDERDMSPRVKLDPEQHTHANQLLTSVTPDDTIIAAHPGSGAAVKSWPVNSWRSTLRRLGEARVILTGSNAESEFCAAIAEGFPHVTSIAGQTSLTALAGVFQRASVVVGTDNGPLHLAGALGTPTVRLFGPSSPARYGPWPGTPGQVVVHTGWSCPRCEDLSPGRSEGCGCMLAITPDMVVEQVRKVLERAA